MFRESFLGRNPSHFHLNPFVKAYIISESLMWAAWNFITPIFALFVVSQVHQGTIQTAALGYSIYLASRVVTELINGRILQGSNDTKKVGMAILGMICIGLAYLGFAVSHTIITLYIFYVLLGIGIGMAMPAKNSLFSIYLDRDKEATEWSMSDAVQFGAMAVATIIGGYIALNFGFTILFYLAFTVNLLAIFPYAHFYFVQKEAK
jgi:MFS family permease